MKTERKIGRAIDEITINKTEFSEKRKMTAFYIRSVIATVQTDRVCCRTEKSVRFFDSIRKLI